MEHIHATPGWEESKWPRSMTLDENRADLERHAADFEGRTGFTYTVLSPGGDVVGCVYIYPSKKDNFDAQVLSWVRVSEAELDAPLWEAVSDCIESDWPFERVGYAARHGAARSGPGPPGPEGHNVDAVVHSSNDGTGRGAAHLHGAVRLPRRL